VRIFTEQLSSDNTVYTQKLRDKSLEVPWEGNPLGEGMLNDAADAVYGNGYDHNDQLEYNEGLDCIRIRDMVAGTNRDWVEDLIKDDEAILILTRYVTSRATYPILLHYIWKHFLIPIFKILEHAIQNICYCVIFFRPDRPTITLNKF